jgi:hypothetical protein
MGASRGVHLEAEPRPDNRSRRQLRDGAGAGGAAHAQLRRAGAGLAGGPDPGAPPDAARKAELASLIREEFSTALERLELTQVAEPGPGVLLVRGAILDVVTRPRSGSSDSGLDFIGQPTFMVELVDASSDSVLARAVDTRAARAPTGRRAAGEADATRALLARWAALLVDALNDLTVIDQYQETRTDA